MNKKTTTIRLEIDAGTDREKLACILASNGYKCCIRSVRKKDYSVCVVEFDYPKEN